LIEEYFRQHQEGAPHDFDINEILLETITKLKSHECKEKKILGFREDSNHKKKKNIPVYGIKSKELREFCTTEKDL
jgi:hypothetical protein